MARTLSSGNYLNRASTITNSATMTAAGWFYFDNTSSYSYVFRQQAAGGYRGATLNGGDSNVYVYSESGGAYGQASVSGFSINTWSHIGGVWNGTSSRTAYLNGTAGTENTTAVTPNDQSETLLGHNSASSSTSAEWAVWDAALTADEMASLAKGFSPLLIRPGSLVAYWPIYGRVSPEPDYVGGLNLTVLGSDTNADHIRMFKCAPAANILGITPASKAIPIFSRTPRFFRRAA